LLNHLIAAFLGVIEGLTEFLPVSSTGHLILFVDLLRFRAPEGRTFEIMIQLGAILAVMLVYRGKIVAVTRGFFAGDRAARQFAFAVLIAFFPAMVLGALLGDAIRTYLFSPWVVGTTLILGGVVMLIAERMRPVPTIASTETMPLGTALLIGLAQCCALVPGVSRSGATIVGAMLLRVERSAAAEFSFFLAMPTMLGAFVYAAWKSRRDLAFDDLSLIAVGFAAAFAAGLVVVRLFLGIVGRFGFAPFAYYRILLGSFVLGLLVMMR
jgi:undecaprenyl-diphosphatase